MISEATDVPVPEVNPVDVVTAVVCTDIPNHVAATQELPPQPSQQPVVHDHAVTDTELHPRTRAGFLHLYGWMGLPMLVIFLLSAAWTFALAVIQQIPEPVANWLMDTAELDDGDFWLLPKPAPALSIPATVLLVLFGFGYVVLAVLMVFPDKMLPSQWHPAHDQEPVAILSSVVPSALTPPITVAKETNHVAAMPKVMPIESHSGKACKVPDATKSKSYSTAVPSGGPWQRLQYEVTSPDGLLRQYYNPILDLPKLIFQTTTLLTYLHNGFPIAVIYIYTCALSINWLISSYRYKRERPDPHFVAARIFYSFDLFFAVFAPMEVLTYAYYTFAFDRDVFATRVATLTPGTFDRTARLFADPTQVSMFRIAFHYLQFTTTDSLLIKSALNLLSLFKWWRTIVHLVEYARASPARRVSVHRSSLQRAALTNVRRRQQLQNWLIAGIFLGAGIAVCIYSIVAMKSSRHVCDSYPQCKVPSYRWNVGAERCSCIVFVDRATEMTTIAEWENPVDTSAHLAALAATGHLRIVQIINRQLPTLPSELRNCVHLEQLILIYTKTLTIPDWAKAFTHLEYLHIEGDLTAKQLSYLPRDLFADMPHLLFVHLGSLVKLPFVPDVDHLQHLEYLALAMLHSITSIPSLASLHNLKRLSIIDAIQLYALPPVYELVHLKAFALTARNPVCCNGYVTGTCDLSDFSCVNRTASGERMVQCTTERIAADDYKVLVATEGEVCERGLTFDLKNLKPTFASVDAACGGVKYKECTGNGAVGICYPARMQPVSCQMKPAYQTMRRLQIARRVGEPCTPSIEGWLGCTA